MKNLLALCSLLIGLGVANTANAATFVAGYTFDDNAFSDSLLSFSGDYTISGGSLEQVLTDSDLTTYAFSFSPDAYVNLGFTDNFLVNGAGDDLVLFELGIPDTFEVSLTVGGITNSYTSSNTGFQAAGYNVNALSINLDDFGVAAGGLLSNVVVGLGIQTISGTVPSLAVVGALNSAPVGGSTSVPEPGSAMAFLALGAFGATSVLKRKQHQAKFN
ncbi:PEP-CTERM sorting domain-containing protein [Planktothrix sp. FACHB-1355]|uniref:PEP-CTERM sorting domain-containing protein n=1 Tax=Aerosakkonema funiforme FACHB-1375 TaxID=2949571 RepID=A0A926VAX3_9CYAN|nr:MULTISPECIES: PEP-CTERM sorting domain-containing protein [Oscillatoriales]MBD2180467.1 PEP-CTERM sorting domain-containing protein [Aerosakkonema funiforme FACHB-1375]MBD3563390.1 PEP-CTERM sorting domain-containing protein [Planktothrix sp. FACHB-1355]